MPARGGDYLANKFLTHAATRRVFRFDDHSGRLEALQIYLRQGSDYLLNFEVTQFTYNPPFAAGVCALQLPPDVRWVSEPQSVANNARHAAMSAEATARAFLAACGRENLSGMK